MATMSQKRYRWKRLSSSPVQRVTDGSRLRGREPAIRQLTICLHAILALALAASAHADRQPGSLSTIKTNPTSGNVEIIHRLHNHDAELGVMTIYADRTLTLDQLRGRAQLALYVEERFFIAGLVDGEIGAPLEVELIGAELDGEFVLVYQELKGELPLQLAVRNDILRDVFPEQVNHVNISVAGKIRSLTFKDNDRWHSTSFE
jgi:hypothetical protein